MEKQFNFYEKNIEFFFNLSEKIDVYIGKTKNKLQSNLKPKEIIEIELEKLERIDNETSENSMEIIFSMCFEIDRELKVIEENIFHLIKLDAFSIFYKHLNLYTQNLVHYKKEAYENFETITYEIHLKILLDLIYLMLAFGYQSKIITYSDIEKKLDWIEDICLDLLNYSLQVPFIPVKKCIFLFGYYLRVLFEDDPNKNESKLPSYEKDMKFITENSVNQMMKAQVRTSLNLKNKVEKFYEKHIKNVQDSPLAQIITVGILRALLATCATNTKSNNQQQGVDINREWENSFIYCSELQIEQRNLSPLFESYSKLLEEYIFYCNNNKVFTNIDKPKSSQEENKEPLFNLEILKFEYDRHRISTAYTLVSFLLMLLKKFKKNCYFQYSYLVQLISDAHGFLVLLKFMTEKFNELKLDFDQSFLTKQNSSNQLKLLLKKSITKILSIIKYTCKNYPEKIKTFLLEYNSYVVLKKLPSYFDNDEKLIKKSSKLIKIQLPFFTKKKKNTAGNMKMISEIYGKFIEPKEDLKNNDFYLLNKLDKYEKNNNRNRPNLNIDNLEILRKVHMDFNNKHYLKPDFENEEIHQDEDVYNRLYEKLWKEVTLDDNFKNTYREWLEENIWNYYD